MLRNPAEAASRHPALGAIRPVGVVVAMVTAAAVFGIGMLVLPPIEPPPPAAPPAEPPAPPAPATPPPSPAPPSVPAPIAADAGVAAAAPPAAAPPAVAPPTGAKPIADEPDRAPPPKAEEPAPKPAGRAELGATEAKKEAEPAPEPKAAPPSKAEAPAPREKGADKEVARDAWRKNLPDVSAEPGKAAMLIPIKGSIEGATYHVTAKPKAVLISLPKGESMITMPFYSVRHDGFRQLWIKKDDEAGTSLRVVLGDASDPQVEIKDDFVRVTIRRAAEAPAEAAPKPAGD
jgi:hypothetical protein